MTIRPSPRIEQEQDKTPLKVVVEPVEEIQMILTRIKTKSMAQVEVIQTDMPGATTSSVTSLPMKMVSVPETRGPVRPEGSVRIHTEFFRENVILFHSFQSSY
jgi:hypothetical protein